MLFLALLFAISFSPCISINYSLYQLGPNHIGWNFHHKHPRTRNSSVKVCLSLLLQVQAKYLFNSRFMGALHKVFLS
jgi:hypothetical protein